ncbi:MAG: rhomboid family intramembrane serine protease [Chloroflexi bacterium]|nr:rhomboid family intramembrane serine protease [Chloroflexota bacterium]
MIPISDDRLEGAGRPYVTLALIAINVAVYLVLQPTIPAVGAIDRLPAEIAAFYDHWALVPARIAHGQALYTLLSAMFLHGGLGHLGGNMLYLWIFGDNVEEALGHGRFLLFYLFCGILAALLQVLLFPASETWTLGASGAIAGVLGAYLVLYPRAMVRVLFVLLWIRIGRLRASVLIAFWFAIQLWSGAGQLALAGAGGGQEGGVAYWAHVGGFGAGFLIARSLRSRLGPGTLGRSA